MPIRPEQRAKYHDNWKNISFRIRFLRAKGQCECTGARGLHSGRRCTEVHGKPASYARGRVVLTCAHLDHDPTNNVETNLAGLCNMCHLRYDAAHHAETRAARRTAT